MCSYIGLGDLRFFDGIGIGGFIAAFHGRDTVLDLINRLRGAQEDRFKVIYAGY